MPESDSLVITPIAPHNLNARPLVISAKHKIRLNVSGREHEYLVSLDSRINSLDNSIGITIKKAAAFLMVIPIELSRELIRESKETKYSCSRPLTFNLILCFAEITKGRALRL